MKNQLSDKELDQIAKNLLQNFNLDETAIDEIADSPKLLWSLKSRISTEKAKREKSWFIGIRWQLAAFATIAVICGIVFAKFFVASENDHNTVVSIETKAEEIAVPPITTKPVTPNSPEVIETGSGNATERKSRRNSTIVAPSTGEKYKNVSISPKRLRKNENSRSIVTYSNKKEVVETTTEFIALSYSPASDSGQIVRVKVPRSMMVSLGVSNNVSKNNEMVKADVIIDDDGSTRAIRFISNK